MSVSPSGARVALEYRGEIVTVPAEKGDPRNITATTAVHERAPEWSPDGRSLAYFSDASGEYALHIRAQDGKGDPKVVPLTGSGFYDAPVWSPDSRHIAFRDNGRVAVRAHPGQRRDQQGRHRADLSSRRVLGHHLQLVARQQVAGLHDDEPRPDPVGHVWSVDSKASFPVTDGLSDVGEPVFDRTASTSTCSARPTPGRFVTGSRRPTPTCARRASSISWC